MPAIYALVFDTVVIVVYTTCASLPTLLKHLEEKIEIYAVGILCRMILTNVFACILYQTIVSVLTCLRI